MSKTQAIKTNPLYRPLTLTLGVCFSVFPPAVCTLLYFPIFKESSPEKLLSLGTLLLLIIAFLPLTRILHARLKSPSATLIWLAIFLLFYTLSKISDEMIVISFFGFVGNFIGSLFFRLEKKVSKDE